MIAGIVGVSSEGFTQRVGEFSMWRRVLGLPKGSTSAGAEMCFHAAVLQHSKPCFTGLSAMLQNLPI